MTNNKDHEGELLPCGFCGAKPEYFYDPDATSRWFHPGTVNSGDCFLRGQGIGDIDLWNRRSQPPASEGLPDKPFITDYMQLAKASEGLVTDALRVAAQGVIDRKFSNYRAKNGREVGIEADDGEKCWIVHSDDIFALEAALQAQPAADVEGIVEICAGIADAHDQRGDIGNAIRKLAKRTFERGPLSSDIIGGR